MTTAPLRFADAYHLTSGTPGPSAVAGCQLDLGRRGVTVRDPDGTPIWSAPWSAVTGLTAVERTTLPDGRTGIVVVVSARPSMTSPEAVDVHRVVVPTDQPASLEAQLVAVARARGIEPEPDARPDMTAPIGVVPDEAVPVGAAPDVAGPDDAAPDVDSSTASVDVRPDGADRSLPIFVVAPAVVGVGAVVAVLLLAAGHVIHL
ncbi:MAG TPA: hypothetical protein VIJ60_04495 [Acidimicrobiales bacterium]